MCSHKTKAGEDVLEVSSYAGPAGGNTLLGANNQPRLLGLVSRLLGMWPVSAEILLAGFIQCQWRQRHAGQDASLCCWLAVELFISLAACSLHALSVHSVQGLFVTAAHLSL